MKTFPFMAASFALVVGCTSDKPYENSPATSASGSALVQASASVVPAASELPVLTAEQEKAAQSIVVNDCLSCHSEELLLQQRLTAKQWAAVVKKMQGWGSLVEPANIDTLVAFLSTHYSTTSSPYVLPSIDAAAAASAIAPLPDGPFAQGEAKKGEALYKEGCASCHSAGGRGSATGVNLVDRPGLWRAVEFAAIVRKGRGRMPAFTVYSDADIASVLVYLRSIHPS